MSTLTSHASAPLPIPGRHRAAPRLAFLFVALACRAATAGVVPPAGQQEVEQAVARSVPLMQESMEVWLQEQSCVSCHHQGLGAMAVSLARERGLPVDGAALDRQIERMSVGAGGYAAILRGDFSINPAFGLSYVLLGRAAAGAPRDDATDAMAHLLAGSQSDDGAYLSESHRPPLEDSAVTSTAIASRALLLYGPEGRSSEIEAKVRRSREWLEAYAPTSNEEHAMRLLGLGWTGASDEVLRRAARDLARGQRADGGWAQIATLSSDAYATGQALVALQQAGALAVDSETYRRGVRFLLETQLEDGSWRVETRRRGRGIPYFESGFPHGLHQFISFAGTAWSTMALCLTIEPGPADVFVGPRPERDVRDTLAVDAGMRDVHVAAAYGTPEDLRRALLSDPGAVEAAGPGGLTPLMLAVHDEHKVELLLEAGADVAASAAHGVTPVRLAGGYAGAHPALERLLSAGASLDPAAVDEALVLAVRAGGRDKVARLLAHGADVEATLPDGRTALQCAAVGGDLDLLRLLLEHGADADVQGFGGMTPLSIAAYSGWTDLVACLVEHGVALDTKDELGMTALGWAAKIDHGHGEIVATLLAAGADPAIPCAGRTAREWAEHFENRPALAALASWPHPGPAGDAPRESGR